MYVSLKTGDSIVSYSTHVEQLRISCHLLKEASLKRTERCVDTWELETSH